MHNDINIQELVQQIWSPDIECSMGNPLPQEMYDGYRWLILAQMVIDYAIPQECYSPYIQIKGHDKRWLYNNRLYIKTNTNVEDIDTEPYHFHVDCVSDITNKEDLYFCIRTGSLADQPSRAGVIDVDPYLPVNYDEILSELLDEHIQDRKALVNTDNILHVQLVIHHIDPRTNAWTIQRATHVRHMDVTVL